MSKPTGEPFPSRNSERERTFFPFKRHGTERFSKHAPSYVQVFKEFSPLILEAISTVSPTSGRPFVIADYGSADGLTSRHVLTECISYLRKTYGTKLPINVIYEDQPINDFTPIFQLNAGQLEEFKNVYILASGTSFYQQCVPPNTIDFLISSCAQHWLSKPPCGLGIMEKTIFSNLATGPERTAYEEQAASDWEKFLLLRAIELKKGGCMVIMKPEEEKAEAILSPMAAVWRDLLDDGEEFRHTNFPFHLSSRRSMELPFLDENSSVRKAGLVLISKMARELQFNPDNTDAENLGNNDIKEQSNMCMMEMKAWSENVFWASLGNYRSEKQKEAILSEHYSRVAQKLCQQGRSVKIPVTILSMVIRKGQS